MEQSTGVERFFSRIVSPQFQTVLALLTGVTALWIAHQMTKDFIASEPQYPLQTVTPTDVARWGGLPAQVEVGFNIYRFLEFDFLRNKFVVECALWFMFDPALISLATIDKFSFENGEILRKPPPQTRLIGDRLFASFNLKIQFFDELNYRNFPLDDHRISIVLVNLQVSPREMMFVGSGAKFEVARGLFTSGWDLYDKRARFGYARSYLDPEEREKLNEYPKAIFSLNFNRSGLKDFFLILLPLFLILFVSVYAFSFDPSTQSSFMFSLSSAAIPALIAYRFIIQDMSPKVGYFMLSDYIFTLFLLFAGLNFIVCLIILRVGKLSEWVIVLRGVSFLCIHVLFIISWYILLSAFST